MPGDRPPPGDRLRLAETFVSRQGEGSLTGVESFFIRTTGCNLRCWFCDTPYASWKPEGDWHSIDAIVAQALSMPTRHVVLTGGEPLIWPNVETLVARLQDASFHVTIETAGTVDRTVSPDLLSLSPKLAASRPHQNKHPAWAVAHEQRRLPLETMRRLVDRAHATQVKFVVCDASEFEEIDSIVDSLAIPPDLVWIMPEGRSVEQLQRGERELAGCISARGFHFCDRMQIHWYGDRRGT